MKVTNEITIYELNGKDVGYEAQHLEVLSHWNRKEWVTIEVCGVKYTVIAEELLKAIANATNWRSY